MVAPLEIVEIVAPVAATYYYPVRCTSVFRAEVFRDDAFWKSIPVADDGSQSGYDLHANTIWFPKGLIDSMDVALEDIRLWGYAPRLIPTSDSDVLELDALTMFAVRAYAKWQGNLMLASDRSLFDQWQVQTKNTDVSINQIVQMSTSAERAWERARNRVRIIRRAR